MDVYPCTFFNSYGIFQAMAIVAHTLVDLVKNLQSFGGIIVVSHQR